jgi:glucose/arabinose dehydrogenase
LFPTVEEVAVTRTFHRAATAAATIVLVLVVVARSEEQGGREGPALSPASQVLGVSGQRFRVTPLMGFSYPWAIAFLPNGDMLVTERPGRLRLVHDFVLDPKPIDGVPPVLSTQFQGLWDVAIHPRFNENRLIYLTYAKKNPSETLPSNATGLQGPSGASVLIRARLEGHALTDVKELFVSNTWISGATAARIVFARDGKLFMSIGAPSRDQQHGGPNRVGTAESAQDPASHAGKVLRLNDDGSVPADNPFVGRAGYKPEIYALGVRNPLGLILHPDTGELMDAEHGPQGGDEVNFIKAGKNYGWPVVSYGRAYSGQLTEGGSGPELAEPCAPGMEQPFLFWAPNIMPGGMTIYTGDRFPAWKGSIFIGGLQSTQLHRVVINNRGNPTRRESLMTELKQRIREVRQGPDGLLYLLTDMTAGAVLKLEPAGE